MLAFRVVRRLCDWLTLALLIISSVAPLSAASDKVRLTIVLDTAAAARGGQTGMEVWAEIARGWHINAHKPNEQFLIPTDVTFTLPPGISADPLNYPKPDRKTFAFAQGKELLVYEGKVGMTTALDVPADFRGDQVRIAATMRYQACNDTTCLPPSTAESEVLVPVSAAASIQPLQTPHSSASATAPADVGAWMAQRGLLVTLLFVGMLGLALNLTPCVYPMISVTIAFFGTQGHHHTTRVALLAALYVLGITLSFAAVGVAAALSGGLFGAALQKPVVLISIAAMLVALALSSFGGYQLRPPRALMHYVNRATRGAAGAFFMGLTMGIVAAPCVGPVVVGLLLFVGSTQSVLLGFELFFALGLGMGLPYLALAMTAGSIKALPRSGEWLVWVEHFFGFMLLALAAYFLQPILPAPLNRWLLPVLVGSAGMYLGFVDRAGHALRSFRSIQRAVGIGVVAVAVWLAAPHRAESSISWMVLDGVHHEPAHAAGRPAIIDFVAEWCIPCHEMDSATFADPAVRAEAARFAMYKADMTRETEQTSAVVDRYAVQGVPTIIFFDSTGKEVQRSVGYIDAGEMLTAMRGVH